MVLVILGQSYWLIESGERGKLKGAKVVVRVKNIKFTIILQQQLKILTILICNM